MDRRRMTLVAALVGVAVLAAALPAVAGKGLSRHVKTGDAAPGGQGHLVYKGDGTFRLSACDVQADDYGVRAYASYAYEKDAKGQDRTDRVRKTEYIAKNTGGKGTCSGGRLGKRKGTRFQARTNMPLHVQVCLRDHDGNRGGDRDRNDHHCGPVKTTAVVSPPISQR